MMEMYTMEDWMNDRVFSAAEGQEVSFEVYNEMYLTLPPVDVKEAGYEEAFGMGEATSCKDGKSLYTAFGKKDGRYYYIGLRQEVE